MRRLLSTRPVVLLVLALLAASAPVAALGLGALDGPQTVPAEGADDGPPTDAPLVPNAMNAVQVLSDPEGDVDFQYVGENPTPPADHDAPVDVLSLTLAETDREVVFSLKHRAYPELQATLSSAWIMNAYCDIAFRLNGDANQTYGVGLDYLLPLEGGYDAWAYVYRSEPQDEDEPRGYYERDHITGIWAALVGNDHFEMVLPKEVFEQDGGPGLKTGDRLTDLGVTCSRDSGTLFLRYYDEVPTDPKARYPVTMAPKTDEIGLSLPEDASGNVAVPVGQTTKVSVNVQNLLQRKLLINLTAEVVGNDGKPLEGWSVTSAPTLEMKTNGTVPASVIVSVGPSVQHREGGILRVKAFPLGFEDQATFTVRVYATAPLGPDQNTLHFHRGEGFSFYCGGICIGGGGVFGEVSDPSPDIFVMNVLESDPLYGQEPGEDDGVALFSTDQAYAYLDAPLGAPIRFDPDGFLELTVALKTEVAREVEFQASIYASNDEYLGDIDERLALTENFETFTFPIPTNENVLNLPRGAQFGIGMGFRESALPGFTGNTWISSVEWDPSQTSLTLPLVAIPQSQVNLTDGRALPSIVLGNNTDKEEYVNPGQAQAFDLVLLNEGIEEDVLRLTAKTSAPGWDVRFDPGNRFELSAGGSAPLCMSVSAPADVQEGDVVNITLTATSKLDEKVRTEIDLVLLVTNHPIEPRACSEISEEDYVKPVTEEEDSPALTPLALLVGLGLVSAVLRRRR